MGVYRHLNTRYYEATGEMHQDKAWRDARWDGAHPPWRVCL